MRLIPYLLYLLILAFYEVIVGELISINHVTVNLAAFMVLVVSMHKGEMAALWFGFICGVVLAAGHPDKIGIQAGMLAALGVSSFHLRRRLNLESLNAKLLLIFGGVFMHNLLTTAFGGPSGLPGALFSPILTGALYTELLAVVFFFIASGKVGAKKIKAIF